MKTIKVFYYLSFFFFSFSLCEGQSWLWGADGSCNSQSSLAEGMQVTIDRAKNAYLVGYLEDTLIFGYDTVTSNPYSRTYSGMYIVKYDSNGNLLWANGSKTISQNGSCGGSSVGTDEYNNVYVTGYFTDTIVFFPDTLIGTSLEEFFLVKYDINGNADWVKKSNVTGYAGGTAIATDQKGDVYVSGGFTSKMIIGADTLNAPGADIFLAQYDTIGNLIWANQAIVYSRYCTASVSSIAYSNTGDIYITGYFIDSVKFGSTILIYPGYDVFLAKCNSAGHFLWAKKGGPSTGTVTGNYVTTDALGNAYITGEFSSSAEFGSLVLTESPGKPDFFIVKYDANGNPIWAKAAKIVDTNGWNGHSLCTDTLGHLYFTAGAVAGYYNNDYLYYGNDTLFLNNALDVSVILELDTAGNLICGSILPSGGDDQNSVICDPSGKYIYMGGDLESGRSFIFGNDTLNGVSEFPWVSCWKHCDNSTEDLPNIQSPTPSLFLFPNPSSGIFTIQLSGRDEKSCVSTIEVYNVMGEKVYSETLCGTQGDNLINLKNQPNGVYFYRVINQSESASESESLIGEGKVVIQK